MMKKEIRELAGLPLNEASMDDMMKNIIQQNNDAEKSKLDKKGLEDVSKKIKKEEMDRDYKEAINSDFAKKEAQKSKMNADIFDRIRNTMINDKEETKLFALIQNYKTSKSVADRMALMDFKAKLIKKYKSKI
jgi:uncharacterized Zn finger protein